MGDVLIDACGWVALIDGAFNIDASLSQLVGPPQFILVDLVLDELETIESSRPRGKRLMLDPLLQRSTMIDSEPIHTDDMLLQIAIERDIPILTIDSDLKRRSLDAGVGILEIVKGKNIRFVNGL